MIGPCSRPSHLAFYCVAVLGAFVIGTALYTLAGDKFLAYVDEKLPEIQAQMLENMELEFESLDLEGFDVDDLSELGGDFDSDADDSSFSEE